ncbi:MAG: hypothetical protein IJE78_08255 [Bacteroidaceae bacterium]|nr:hypothetical protein [Bacteroidaceae bacterium]
MAKLSYKVSYYIFYVLVVLILVTLGLFFGVGYNNPMGEYNAPEHTETLMFLMYAMFAVCVLVTVLGGIAQFFAGLKDDPKGAMKSVLALVLFAAVLVGAYVMGSDEPLMMADGTEFTDATMLKLSDMMIYAIYLLLGVAGVATLVNLSGIFKR